MGQHLLHCIRRSGYVEFDDYGEFFEFSEYSDYSSECCSADLAADLVGNRSKIGGFYFSDRLFLFDSIKA